MTLDTTLSPENRPEFAVAIERAAELLRTGKLVAFPTETVYGLGADATSEPAVARIYSTKRRPFFNPLICHVADLQAAQREGQMSDYAQLLAEKFWPGPLTLVVPVAPATSVCELARAGLPTIALRVPSHPIALRLAQSVGRPIAAPSANPAGAISATTAAHVLADFGQEIDMVLDGGATDIGLESTIIGCEQDRIRILRPGAIARQAIEAVLGHAVDVHQVRTSNTPVAPGMLASHYAPRARLRLNARTVMPGEAILDFGGQFATAAVLRAELSPHGDLVEAGANLFAHLRALDGTGVHVIAVAPIPAEGLGEAINDRLNRAAAPRD
jgi:L-threonylcarbamoyladenylate synthase